MRYYRTSCRPKPSPTRRHSGRISRRSRVQVRSRQLGSSRCSRTALPVDGTGLPTKLPCVHCRSEHRRIRDGATYVPPRRSSRYPIRASAPHRRRARRIGCSRLLLRLNEIACWSLRVRSARCHHSHHFAPTCRAPAGPQVTTVCRFGRRTAMRWGAYAPAVRGDPSFPQRIEGEAP